MVTMSSLYMEALTLALVNLTESAVCATNMAKAGVHRQIRVCGIENSASKVPFRRSRDESESGSGSVSAERP